MVDDGESILYRLYYIMSGLDSEIPHLNCKCKDTSFLRGSILLTRLSDMINAGVGHFFDSTVSFSDILDICHLLGLALCSLLVSHCQLLLTLVIYFEDVEVFLCLTMPLLGPCYNSLITPDCAAGNKTTCATCIEKAHQRGNTYLVK